MPCHMRIVIVHYTPDNCRSRTHELRVTPAAGAVQSGPQMTASYFGAADDWKRLAIPLDRAYAASEIAGLHRLRLRVHALIRTP